MATNHTPTAGAALGNELRAGTVAKVGSTKRIQELNGMLHSNRPNVDITRARAYTKVYRETEGMPSMMRRYKASAEVYRSLSDNVYDYEQLVGWPTKRIRGANFAIELHAHWLADDLPNLRGRTYDPFEITDEDYRELEEDLLPYWKEKTMAVQWGHYVDPKEWDRAQFGGVSDVSNYLCANGSHFIPSWTDVIEHGFVKYYEKAKALRAALDPNDPESVDKRIFYNGIIEVLEAIRDWGERMSAACARKAAQETDPVRKQELEKMAEMMTRVPWGPATSFYDACETAWAVCFFLFVEGAGPSITWGRFDQYMYPYYKADIEKGILTPESAMELIEELYVRVTSNVWFQSTQMAYIFLCQVGTKKILRIYKPFIGGQPPVNGLRFLYSLVPFFVRRFLYAAANASIIGVTGSSLSGLDRYSNRMPFSRNFRSNLMKEEVSRLIREVSRVRIVPMS